MCHVSVMYSERLPFISQGDVFMAVGTPTGGPNDVVQDNILFIIMASQVKEISLPNFLACSWNPRSACPGVVLSERRQA